MNIISSVLIVFVALLHIYFLILEMFLWTKPIGMKAFGFSMEKAQITKVLAINQGLYNGFLAAGLIWSLFERLDVAIFFLCCVVIAGIVGGLTASKKIFFIQSVPAILALISLFF